MVRRLNTKNLESGCTVYSVHDKAYTLIVILNNEYEIILQSVRKYTTMTIPVVSSGNRTLDRSGRLSELDSC